jgi:metallophosphoesterase (TIGR00282 family)
MNILFVGDIMGRPGRTLLNRYLHVISHEHKPDIIIVNAENAAGGFGITRDIGEELLGLGIDVMTSGNHIWDKKEVLSYIETEPRLLRPSNFPTNVPGRGTCTAHTSKGQTVGVINAMGRIFMLPLDNPFVSVLEEIEKIRHQTRIIIVDFHAEATSEKMAMGWHLDGKVTAVVGTHTHVQTADERILPKGTAYITDVGMTGPHDSIIGMEREAVMSRFLTGMPSRFEAATENPRLNGVLISVDEKTGCSTAIKRISASMADLEKLNAKYN